MAQRATPETTEQRVALALREHWATPVVQVIPARQGQTVTPEPLGPPELERLLVVLEAPAARVQTVTREPPVAPELERLPEPQATPEVRPRQPMPMRPL